MRTNVEVICSFSKNGEVKPLYIVWENGAIYAIKKINKVIPLKNASTSCVKYICVIGNNTRDLFLEEGKWFVENRNMLYN